MIECECVYIFRSSGGRTSTCYRACEGRVTLTGDVGGFGFDPQMFSLWKHRFEENHGFQHGTNLSTGRYECLWIISRSFPVANGVVSLPALLSASSSSQYSPDNFTQIELSIDQSIKTHCHRVLYIDHYSPIKIFLKTCSNSVGKCVHF